jgi:hypothetical protein
VRACVSNRDTDPPMQKLLHAVDILCSIDYYEACQRKKRANSWNDCHSRIECLDSKSAIKKLLGFHACNLKHVSLASGRTVFSSCGADPSKAKKRLSAPTPLSCSSLLRVSSSPRPAATTPPAFPGGYAAYHPDTTRTTWAPPRHPRLRLRPSRAYCRYRS